MQTHNQVPECITVNKAFNDRLKSVCIYNPSTNQSSPTLFDPQNNLVIGLNDKSPYFPAGGHSVISQILVGTNGMCGLIIGSVVFGFSCRHCHDDVYMLDGVTRLQ